MISIIGFIPYNRHHAMIFMGDSGSMYIGFILGILSVASLANEIIFISKLYLLGWILIGILLIAISIFIIIVYSNKKIKSSIEYVQLSEELHNNRDTEVTG